MCSSLESAYQALYKEFLTKSRHNDIPSSPTRSDLETCSESITRSQLSRVLELQESLFAPIRILPLDVLTDIFKLVIETSSKPGITSWKSPKLSGCIFALTWICSRWRDMALSNSTFWSRIQVIHGFWDEPPTAEVTAFLNECILRSGVSVPMSITISSRRNENLPALNTMLVAQAHRWRQATLFLSSQQEVDSVFPFEPSSTRFPLLEDLSFDSDEANIASRIFECHPPLQKLGLGRLWESYTGVIASRNLKVLKIHSYIGVSLARLLHLCPCLEFLKIQSFKFKENADAKKITCWSSLSTLDIGGSGDVDNGAWTGVTLPKLTKLNVTLPTLAGRLLWETAYDATSLVELKEVVKRSKGALQRVNLIVYVKNYGEEVTLETGLPVKAEGSFVENMLLQEWKEFIEEAIDEQRRSNIV
ncbi:hypothetical protein BDP27DRAFT_1328942 [Rhodocollybia butyracea]|uniref:F-box domain-containing protein n=1 Tax=Rhodocollybia butyracea TaxID=206335 RepID=A0A9P5U5R8_9AGAR|nr:hypothetical protein BDP27DRAFT_1328942 [Rhodocollybia butyracea]